MRQSHIGIVGVPLDLGSGRRGVDMGPSAVRVARLHDRLRALGYQVDDLGNIAVDQLESGPEGAGSARYLSQIAGACGRLAEQVGRIAARDHFPLVLGGDHSIAVGSVSAMSNHYARAGQQLGLIWVDAHADMNTPETSPSGNVHGMPLACLVGMGPEELTGIGGPGPKITPEHVALIGVRDIDQLEKPHVRESGVRAFTMRHIDERVVLAVVKEALHIATAGTAGFHVSFDLDVVDPREAPGVGTPVRGGLTYREAHLVLETLCDSGGMVSMEVVEINPILDDANRTAAMAVELIMSAMGKRIL
jgi:arginase